MNAAEYFRRAEKDPGFRQQQLDDLRYYKNVTLGALVTLSVCGTYQIIACCADWEGRKSGIIVVGALSMIGVAGLAFWSKVKTIAALKAMDPRIRDSN